MGQNEYKIGRMEIWADTGCKLIVVWTEHDKGKAQEVLLPDEARELAAELVRMADKIHPEAA